MNHGIMKEFPYQHDNGTNRAVMFLALAILRGFISLETKNPVGNNKQRFLVDKQSLLLVERSLTVPGRGVHQTHPLQVCDLYCPAPSIRLLLGMLLPKSSFWDLPE